jgi:hypothetical protein
VGTIRHLANAKSRRAERGFALAEEDAARQTSTPAEKFIYTSSRQTLACIGPLKRLRHSSIEVLDEIDQRLMQLLDGVETGATEKSAYCSF